MNPKTIIEIPDPAMTQDAGGHVNFIETAPPSLDGLEVRIRDYIINDIIYYKNVGNYLLNLAILARRQGFTVTKTADLITREQIFAFTKNGGPENGKRI